MKRIPNTQRRMFEMVIALLLGVALNAVLFSQETDKLKRELFREIDTSMQRARQEEVPALSPTLFAKATEFYRRAEVEYQNGERLDKIRKSIAEVGEALNKAVEAARVTKVALAKVLEARQQVALHEFIRKLAPKKFGEAERYFREAILKAEEGDIRNARTIAERSLRSYREATIHATERGPMRETSDKLERLKKTLSPERYAKAARELQSLKSTIRNAKNQEFEILAWVDDISGKMNVSTLNAQDKFQRSDSKMGKVTVKPRFLWLLAQQGSGDFIDWVTSWKDTEFPNSLRFRWSHNSDEVGFVGWEVWGNGIRIQGPVSVGTIPPKLTNAYFYIPFSDIVGVDEGIFEVYIVAYNKDPLIQESGLTITPKILARLQPPVTVGTIGATDTQFTFPGLHPELYEQMRIHIDLESLEIFGSGYDEDPYLFVVVVYADGTTIVPFFDHATQNEIYFPSSSVRIDSAPETHGNVPGGDPGDKLTIPASTGHFENVIEPIGLRLSSQLGLGAEVKRGLREVTLAAIVVIGFEEDAIPSTDSMNEGLKLFVEGLREKLNNIIPERIAMEQGEALELLDLDGAVADIGEEMMKELTDFAEAEGEEEAWIKIGALAGWITAGAAVGGAAGGVWAAIPAVFAAIGALNGDDYIGHDSAIFSYQQILDAGTEGIPIKMILDQNCKWEKPRYLQRKRTETIYYRIRGRIRLIIDE